MPKLKNENEIETFFEKDEKSEKLPIEKNGNHMTSSSNKSENNLEHTTSNVPTIIILDIDEEIISDNK